jgi:hypothetical protein
VVPQEARGSWALRYTSPHRGDSQLTVAERSFIMQNLTSRLSRIK